MTKKTSLVSQIQNLSLKSYSFCFGFLYLNLFEKTVEITNNFWFRRRYTYQRSETVCKKKSTTNPCGSNLTFLFSYSFRWSTVSHFLLWTSISFVYFSFFFFIVDTQFFYKQRETARKNMLPVQHEFTSARDIKANLSIELHKLHGWKKIKWNHKSSSFFLDHCATIV